MTKIEDIVNKEFSRSFMGYDMREVDYFLDEIIEQFETYERERQEMLTAMEYLLRELEQFDDIADEAEKQLHNADGEPDTAVSGNRARRRATHVHPVVPPADPAQETPETTRAEETVVLEEFETFDAAPTQEEPPLQPDVPPVWDGSGEPEVSGMQPEDETAPSTMDSEGTCMPPEADVSITQHPCDGPVDPVQSRDSAAQDGSDVPEQQACGGEEPGALEETNAN